MPFFKRINQSLEKQIFKKKLSLVALGAPGIVCIVGCEQEGTAAAG
jgi:hypothetical protein